MHCPYSSFTRHMNPVFNVDFEHAFALKEVDSSMVVLINKSPRKRKTFFDDKALQLKLVSGTVLYKHGVKRQKERRKKRN